MVNTELINIMPKEFLEHYVTAIPAGRIIEIKEVINCVEFLLSEDSKMITGTTITIDGGHTCYLPV